MGNQVCENVKEICGILNKNLQKAFTTQETEFEEVSKKWKT